MTHPSTSPEYDLNRLATNMVDSILQIALSTDCTTMGDLVAALEESPERTHANLAIDIKRHTAIFIPTISAILTKVGINKVLGNTMPVSAKDDLVESMVIALMALEQQKSPQTKVKNDPSRHQLPIWITGGPKF